MRKDVSPKRRIARDAGREHRIHDVDLAAGTERGAHAGRRRLIDAPGEHGGEPRHPAHPHRSRLALANASGSSAASVQRRSLCGPTAITSRSSPNSASSCRQAPHGEAGGSASVATTMRLSARAPAATAAPSAIRSAQIVSPYDALSTLRSEEHTSELQSQSNLVCRLLLEKTKNSNHVH